MSVHISLTEYLEKIGVTLAPITEGSEKQITWATQIRLEKFTAETSGERFDEGNRLEDARLCAAAGEVDDSVSIFASAQYLPENPRMQAMRWLGEQTAAKLWIDNRSSNLAGMFYLAETALAAK